ncbi:MAG: LysM peptidoglycan-binding domain-containing protein [Rhabdochlamydiaceae bacterium]
MDKSSSHLDLWMKKTKSLTQWLILSGALNIGLLASSLYFVIKEQQNTIEFDHKPLDIRQNLPQNSLESTINRYMKLSFKELINLLLDNGFVEQGFSQRDLALSCLVNFHYFNLNHALSGSKIQERKIRIKNGDSEEELEIKIFPGLLDYQFQAVHEYALSEKWPLTTEGLFQEIKQADDVNLDLWQTFYLTQEFHSVYTLFHRSGILLPKPEILKFLKEGDFNLLNDFVCAQKLEQDLSIDRLKRLLTDYLSCRSKRAAYWLLELDLDFVSRRLDDSQLLTILDLVPPQNRRLSLLIQHLVVSPRSDAIWKKSCDILYRAHHQIPPEKMDKDEAISRFLPHLLTVKTIEKVLPLIPHSNRIKGSEIKKKEEQELKKTTLSPKIHIVSQGDSLWKISRQYRVKLDALVKANDLKRDVLRLGQKIMIPSSES